MAVEYDVQQGRSPRYPKFSIMASLGYARRLYDGAHRSVVDTITAYRVMGFSGKSGASATALGSVRQFGLVEAVKGGVRISDLGLQLLEPSSEEEFRIALQHAAKHPNVFRQIIDNFGTLPKSDEPIRAFLIRTLDFSQSGADDCISSLRETITSLSSEGSDGLREESSAATQLPAVISSGGSFVSDRTEGISVQNFADVIRIPLSRTCTAEIRFSGSLSVSALDRLIGHIALMKDVWADEL